MSIPTEDPTLITFVQETNIMPNMPVDLAVGAVDALVLVPVHVQAVAVPVAARKIPTAVLLVGGKKENK